MARPRNATVRRNDGVAPAFRSRSEEKTAAFLRERGVSFEYEGERVEYIKPAMKAHYTPDFYLSDREIYVEVKGLWIPSDRQKIALVLRQHPELDIRMLFDRPDTPINAGSSTSYARWCDANGIKWAKGPMIPNDWL